MNRIDGIDINIYWSDLTKEAKEDIVYHLMLADIKLSPMIIDDKEPFTWKNIDMSGN